MLKSNCQSEKTIHTTTSEEGEGHMSINDILRRPWWPLSRRTANTIWLLVHRMWSENAALLLGRLKSGDPGCNGSGKTEFLFFFVFLFWLLFLSYLNETH